MKILLCFRPAVVVFCCALLSACAVRPIESAKLSQIHSVGVLSLMNPQVNCTRIGTTVFTNEFKKTPTDRLDLHDLGEQIVARTLRGVRAETLASERTRIANLTRISATEQFITGRGLNPKAWQSELGRLRREHGYDAVILLLPSTSDAYDSNTSLQGYGIYQRSFFGNETTLVHALQRFEIYDAATGEQLRRVWSANGQPVSDAAFRQPESDEVRNAFVRAIGKNATRVLSQMGFATGDPGPVGRRKEPEILDW